MLRPWSNRTLFPSFSIFYLFLCLLIFKAHLRAEETRPETPETIPISITSEKMTLKNLESKIIFEGSVLIHRGEVEIKADKAEVHLGKPEEGSSLMKKPQQNREVEKIIATGNVRIVRGVQTAKADRGIYKRGEDVFILTGNPEVWDKDVHVKGKMITFFIQEERTLVDESQAVIQNMSSSRDKKK